MNLLFYIQPDEAYVEIEEKWHAYPYETDGCAPAWVYECFDQLEVFY